MTPADEHDLVECIYDAGTEPERFPALLSRLARAFSAQTTNLNVIDARLAHANLCFTHGMPQPLVESYAARYAECDEWILGARRTRMTLGRVYLGDQLVSDARLRRSEFHADFLTELDIFHNLGAGIAQWEDGQAAVSVQRSPRRAPFSADDASRFERLVPHLRRAVGILRRTVRAEERARLARHLAACDPVARIVVDHGGRLRHANARGEALLVEGTALRLRAGRVAARHEPTDARLAGLIRAVAAREAAFASAAGRVVAVPRWGAARPLMVSVLPAPDGEVALSPRRRNRVLLHIADPDDLAPLSVDALQTWFVLTPSEARLAALLADGRPLRRAAETLGITHESARQYLKRLFRKTACHRQSDLVRVLGSARGLPTA